MFSGCLWFLVAGDGSCEGAYPQFCLPAAGMGFFAALFLLLITVTSKVEGLILGGRLI